jgi:nucleoside-diphosphate-sugar epimerase
MLIRRSSLELPLEPTREKKCLNVESNRKFIMKLLIPAGAGYIGSHMVRYAQEHGYDIVVLDDFSTSHEWAIKDCETLRVDLLDQAKLAQLLKGRLFDGVIHFAAKSLVGESVQKPDFHYRNNVVGTLNLVNEMISMVNLSGLISQWWLKMKNFIFIYATMRVAY